MTNENSEEVCFDEPPKYGLKVALNHEYPIQSKQIIRPNPKVIFDLVGLFGRYLKYYVDRKRQKKRPVMDYMTLISAQRMYGCPIGGIGGGTIGRGFKGEFCRFQMCPGIYEYVTIPECQFIVNIRNGNNETIFQSVLSTYDKPKKAPESWEWNINGADCEYTGLYPRAWTTYDLSKYGIKLVCRQISPVLPHNYKDSSLPCAVFVWSVKNVCSEHRAVSITFTWAEILNDKKKLAGKLEIERYSEEHTCGVSLEQKIAGTPCTFTIAKRKDETETIHEGYCKYNVAKGSSYVWESLQKSGKLEPKTEQAGLPSHTKDASDKKEKSHLKKTYRCDGIGLTSVISLEPGDVNVIEFCLAWDMPIVKFKKNGKSYRRYYTKYFGSDGVAGPSIAAYALASYKKWEKELAEWQEPILNNSKIPDWLKTALMNQMYFIADGGTIWFDVQDEFPEMDPRHTFGLFGYLEGHEYRMYNTYDVHYYASFALAQLWPNLQVVVQYMFRDTIPQQTADNRKSLYDGKTTKSKVKDSVPHDLGDPEDDPFTNINAYNIHDVSEWRDLNSKFILQVMRDYKILKDLSVPFGSDRYDSLEYIDDILDGTEGDLYFRSTGQSESDYVPVKRVRIQSQSESLKPLTSILNSDGNEDKENSPAGNILEMLYRSKPAKRAYLNGSAGREEAGGEGAQVWDARTYLADMYSSCELLVRRMLAWDVDGDGLIENSGLPDQTYDTWVMSGPSAYCGGLWLTSLFFMKSMCEILDKKEKASEYDALLQRAHAAYEDKLWCGTHYRFDVQPKNSRVIMAGGLGGHWYLRAAGFAHTVLPEDHVKTALKTIYENNVLKFNSGNMGAINGYVLGDGSHGGHIDHTTLQSEEMWTGVTYGLAALMLHEGMHEEAFKTAGGMYDSLTNMGLSFETPEALYENGNHRSIAYMRPLAIWAMYHALATQTAITTQPVASTRPLSSTPQVDAETPLLNGSAPHTDAKENL